MESLSKEEVCCLLGVPRGGLGYSDDALSSEWPRSSHQNNFLEAMCVVLVVAEME